MSTLELDMRGQLKFAGEIRKYILGGNATFTLVSDRTGQRFTYNVKSSKKDRNAFWSTGNQDKSAYFVSLLTGPDNAGSYSYIGMLSQRPDGHYDFHETAKSRARKGSPSFDGFAYCWNSIEHGCAWPSRVEFYHEGSCCMCGRKLTVPESVASGIGPDCAAKFGV